MFMKSQFSALLVSIFIISACGGGGGGSSPAPASAPTSTPTPPVVTPQWADPITLPTPTEYLPQSGSVFTSMVIPVDLYNDGYTDLIVHYWYQEQDDVVDALVFYNNDSGNWSIKNEEVFGSKLVQMNVTTRKYVVGDLNNDGIDDVALAVNKEDGTQYQEQSEMYAKPIVLLSNNGTYSIEEFGNADWLHAVDIKNGVVSFAGFGSDIPAQSYTYNGTWNSVDIPNVSGLTFKYVGDYILDYGDRLNLYSNGSIVDSLLWEYTMVPIQVWTGQISNVKLITLDGEDYIGAGVDTLEVFENTVVARFQGRLIEGGYVDGTNYVETELPVYNKMLFFDTSAGSISSMSSPIKNEVQDKFYNFFKIKDVNNDGYYDVFVSLNQSTPAIYLNNMIGDLELYTDTLPTTDNSNVRSEFIDFNNDQVNDILITTITNISPEIKIYKAKENL